MTSRLIVKKRHSFAMYQTNLFNYSVPRVLHENMLQRRQGKEDRSKKRLANSTLKKQPFLGGYWVFCLAQMLGSLAQPSDWFSYLDGNSFLSFSCFKGNPHFCLFRKNPEKLKRSRSVRSWCKRLEDRDVKPPTTDILAVQRSHYSYFSILPFSVHFNQNNLKYSNK